MSNSLDLVHEIRDILKASYKIARETYMEYVAQHTVEENVSDDEGPVSRFQSRPMVRLEVEEIEDLAAEDEALV